MLIKSPSLLSAFFRIRTLPPHLTPSEAFAMYRTEGGRRTSSRRECSLVRSRVATNLLLKNFCSSSASKRRESVQDFHQQMEICQEEMSAQMGSDSLDSDEDEANVGTGFNIVRA